MIKQKRYSITADLLRILAAVSVLLYHSDYDTFKYGYLGVDIFLVISGYLMTDISIRLYHSHSFSILSFYFNRIRRIVPQVLLMLSITTVIGYFFLDPFSYEEFAKAAASTLMFVANFYFDANTNYFALDANFAPLIHMWSLSLEEQYYLLFPIFILFALRNTSLVTRVFIIIFVLSLAYYSILLAIESRSAFYMLPARVWEFIFGSIVALHAVRMYVIAIALMFVTSIFILLFDVMNMLNLITVSLAGSLLFFGKRFDYVANKYILLFANLSFGIYIWHQPIFAFFRYQTNAQVSGYSLVVLTFITLLVAYLAYFFVERPIRESASVSRHPFYFLSILVFCSVFLVIVHLSIILGKLSNTL